MRDIFRRAAQGVARALGTPLAFLTAVLFVVGWALSGPIFNYSDSWQLFINTGTTVTTFLMVFLIQNTQNRDATVFHLKLDELIRAVKEARTELVDMENLSEEQIERLRAQFSRLRENEEARRGAPPTDDLPATPNDESPERSSGTAGAGPTA
jgi:low affinity Fe/Cu permease